MHERELQRFVISGCQWVFTILYLCWESGGLQLGVGLVSMETDIPLKVLGSLRQLLSLGNGLKFSVKCLRDVEIE